jgi:ABC-type glycerol-3-phosphate transport system substrate-binding protein
MTYGKIGGVFIVKNSTNLAGAYSLAYKMVFGELAREITNFGVVPARRDLLTAQSEDPFQPIFYDGALISKAWIDPYPKESDRIFHDMIEGIVIGKETVSDSLGMAREALARILRGR